MKEGIGPDPDQLNLDLGDEIQQNKSEDENNDPKRFEVLQIPSVEHESNTVRGELRKDPERIQDAEKKLIYLESLVNDYKDKEFADIMKTFREKFEAYRKRLENFQNAPDTGETIPARIKKLKSSDIKETSAEAISEGIKRDFENAPGNKVGLADSHMLTIYELTEAFKARTDKEASVGVLVFDNHIDLYDHGGSHDWKGNVFQKLYESEVIDKATFIGGEPNKKLIDRQNNELAAGGETAFDQISAEDIRVDGKVDRPGLVQKIKDTIDEYKKAGITNLVFSVDIDVLRVKELGYTAMEYTPMNYIGYLASLDIPMDKKFDDLTGVEQNDIEELVKEAQGHRYSPGAVEGDTFDPHGMALGDIGVALDTMSEKCKEEGIELGIKLTGGGKYLGDVVELAGADLGERTTRATSALLQRINKISDSFSESEQDQEPVAKAA